MYESENKGLSGILKISPRAELSCEQGEIKAFWVSQAGRILETQVHRWNSSVWVQKDLNLFQQEHYLKLLLPPFPHLLSEQNGAWVRPKTPGRGRGQASQRYRLLRVLCLEGVAFATGLANLLWQTPFWHPSLKAHSSAEKGAQGWVPKPSWLVTKPSWLVTKPSWWGVSVRVGNVWLFLKISETE